MFTPLGILMPAHHMDIILFYTVNTLKILLYDFHGFMSSKSPASVAGLV